MKHFAIILIIILCSALTQHNYAIGADGVAATEKPGDFEKLRNSYKEPEYKNIMDLYWKTSQLDINNTDHLDLYLILKECEISKQYFKNDFEWHKIREAVKSHLEASRENLNNRFYVIQPLKLSSYSFERGGFDILPEYQYADLKRFRISNNRVDPKDFCVSDKSYNEPINVFAPYNLSVNLRDGFTMTYVPMSEDVSKAYLNFLDNKKTVKIAGQEMVRDAFVVFYLTLDSFLQNEMDYQAPGVNLKEYKAKLDFIEVYADQELKRPLYYRRVN